MIIPIPIEMGLIYAIKPARKATCNSTVLLHGYRGQSDQLSCHVHIPILSLFALMAILDLTCMHYDVINTLMHSIIKLDIL